MKKKEQWWQKSTCYDIKFIEEFLKEDTQQKVIKVIDTFKLQQAINKLKK